MRLRSVREPCHDSGALRFRYSVFELSVLLQAAAKGVDLEAKIGNNLAALKEGDEFVPKIKVSENSEKITNPGNKTIFRLYDKETGKMRADLIAFVDETIDPEKDLRIFDPIETWKNTLLKGGTYRVREILEPVFIKGECVYDSPPTMEIAEYCKKEKDTLWDETRRLVNPQKVYVDLSDKLYDVKKKLLDAIGTGE